MGCVRQLLVFSIPTLLVYVVLPVRYLQHVLPGDDLIAPVYR